MKWGGPKLELHSSFSIDPKQVRLMKCVHEHDDVGLLGDCCEALLAIFASPAQVRYLGIEERFEELVFQVAKGRNLLSSPSHSYHQWGSFRRFLSAVSAPHLCD